MLTPKLVGSLDVNKAAIKVKIEDELRESSAHIICIHFEIALCAEACPVGAFYKKEDTQAWVIDQLLLHRDFDVVVIYLQR